MPPGSSTQTNFRYDVRASDDHVAFPSFLAGGGWRWGPLESPEQTLIIPQASRGCHDNNVCDGVAGFDSRSRFRSAAQKIRQGTPFFLPESSKMAAGPAPLPVVM